MSKYDFHKPKNVDDRPAVVALLQSLKDHLDEMEELVIQAEVEEGVIEEGVYRFYHQSFKVYRFQDWTSKVVELFRKLSPTPGAPLDPYFEEILTAGTGKEFELAHNQAWTRHTRPIVEAAFHAHYFLSQAVKYARNLSAPPALMPSGWAALLTLYGIR